MVSACHDYRGSRGWSCASRYAYRSETDARACLCTAERSASSVGAALSGRRRPTVCLLPTPSTSAAAALGAALAKTRAQARPASAGTHALALPRAAAHFALLCGRHAISSLDYTTIRVPEATVQSGITSSGNDFGSDRGIYGARSRVLRRVAIGETGCPVDLLRQRCVEGTHSVPRLSD